MLNIGIKFVVETFQQYINSNTLVCHLIHFKRVAFNGQKGIFSKAENMAVKYTFMLV